MSSSSSSHYGESSSSSPSRRENTNSNKRRHCDRGDENEDNDYLKSGRKRRSLPETPWKSWGREVTRLIDPFNSVWLCAHTFKQIKKERKRVSELSSNDQQLYCSFILICDHNVDFKNLVTDSSNTMDRKQMLEEMGSGQDGARDADTHTIKKIIVDMVRALYSDKPEVLSGLQANSKVNRGFKNEVLGELLCPIDMDWNDPTTKEKLIANPALASTKKWPLFLYPRDQFDRENISAGLLRGELLVWAYKAIFIGPSKWQPDEPTVFTQICNARRHGMTSVTARSIAYVASQVRAALSSISMNTKSGGFSQDTFFWHIVKFLESPIWEEEVADLMTWWNGRIFPSRDDGEELPEDDEDSFEKMTQQREAKQAAFRDVTNEAV